MLVGASSTAIIFSWTILKVVEYLSARLPRARKGKSVHCHYDYRRNNRDGDSSHR